jgi:outer membrane lipoprotein SlyB
MERDRRSAIDCARCNLVAPAMPLREITVMKTIAVIFAVATLALASTSADAKGCLKGAAVGGVAGHYAGHHGVLGAVAGCIYGRRHARQQQLQQQQQGQAPAGQEKL